MYADEPGTPRRGNEGFTLVEVLFAIVILAVGLLGLEALGVNATRATALAEKQNEYSLIAASVLEELRNNVATGQAASIPSGPGATATPINARKVVVTPGDTASVTGKVTSRGVADQATLSVTVSPLRAATGRSQVRASSLTISSFIFSTNLP